MQERLHTPRSASCVISLMGSMLRDFYFAKHACLHVVEQMAVIRPAAECISGNCIADALCRIDGERVLANLKLASLVLDFAPHSMQVNGVRHHGIVHKSDAQPLTIVEPQRLRL